MADIELVIKIPEEIRLALINNVQLSSDQQSICDSCIKHAIINGISLPKSLIDADKVQEKINKLLKEPDYQHEGEDWRTGLIMAEELIADASHEAESEGDKE